ARDPAPKSDKSANDDVPEHTVTGARTAQFCGVLGDPGQGRAGGLDLLADRKGFEPKPIFRPNNSRNSATSTPQSPSRDPIAKNTPENSSIQPRHTVSELEKIRVSVFEKPETFQGTSWRSGW